MFVHDKSGLEFETGDDFGPDHFMWALTHLNLDFHRLIFVLRHVTVKDGGITVLLSISLKNRTLIL